MLNSAILINDQIESAPKKSRSLEWYHRNKEKAAAYNKDTLLNLITYLNNA